MRNNINNWYIKKRLFELPGKTRVAASLVRRSAGESQTITTHKWLEICLSHVAEFGKPGDTVTIVEPDGTKNTFPWKLQENENHEISLVIPTTTDIDTMRQALIILGANNPLRNDWDQYMLDVARWGLIGGPQPNPEDYGFTTDEIRTDTWFLTTNPTENDDEAG